MIRVLVVTSSFPRSREDWSAQFVFNIYKHFPRGKYKVTVLTPHAPGARLFEQIEGIRIIRFPYFFPFSLQKITTGSGVIHSSKRSLLAKIQIATFICSENLFLWYLLFRHQYDIIHAHWILPQGVSTIVAASLFHIPVVVTVHGSDVFALKPFNFLKQWVLNHSAVCTVNSKATEQIVKRLSPHAATMCIPMGVDMNVFKPEKRNKKFHNDVNTEGGPIILAVGRFIKWKGFHYLIQAIPFVLNSYPNARFILIGSGPEEAYLKQIADNMSLIIDKQIQFLPTVSHKRLAVIMSSSDVFVVPSITDEQTGEMEAQGLVAIEALSSGVPLIVTNSGGLPYIIDNNTTGLVVKERNANVLSSAIVRLLRDRDKQKLFVANGLRLVKDQYSWDKIGKKFDTLLTDVYRKAYEV